MIINELLNAFTCIDFTEYIVAAPNDSLLRCRLF